MKFNTQRYSQFFKHAGFYIPFTWYSVLFAIGGFVGYEWLQTQAGIPDSAFGAIFALLLRFAVIFCFVVLWLGLLSVTLSVCYFLWKKKKQGIDFHISTQSRNDDEQSKQTISIHLHPILKPFMGFVKMRLKYDNSRFSDKFSVIKKSNRKFFSTTIDGVYHWQLPEIKEYKVERVIIYFEDFFQFFSFALPLSTSKTFYTQPLADAGNKLTAFPRKTEDTSIRIEELKRVEGEHINYKSFENNDDVRRIVWKIYAKNKELVVRIPEILDPYASHIYLYSSYFSAFYFMGNDMVEVPFLNYFKTYVWSVYKQLQQKGFEVRFVPDQEIPLLPSNDTVEQVKYSISVSSWQTQTSLKDYIRPKDASVVVISSLSDADELKTFLESHGNEMSFVFVSLTQAMKGQNLGDWLQWLFIQQEKDQIAMYKTSWSLSLLRLKVVKNEKAILKLLEEYGK